jgi:glycine dehydrogenase
MFSSEPNRLAPTDTFVRRHIGPDPEEQGQMLAALGLSSLEALAQAVVPSGIRLDRPLQLPAPLSEAGALGALQSLAGRNRVFRSYLGMGYSDCLTPAVIQRNLLENPGWYTQYTPYQAEIAQGRLEGLLNFQTMICDLTGLAIANASLLDEATAAAEAMTLCVGLKSAEGRDLFLVSGACHPQNLEVIRTRARPLGIEVRVVDDQALPLLPEDVVHKLAGVLVQYPDTTGAIHDFAPLGDWVHAKGGLLVVAADLLALTLLKPPGEFGADIAVGSAQRFGVPLGFGGPHAAYFAIREAFKRHLPGRLVGVSRDSRGRPALRLSLQTREQHIRREKATSNICTAQALLANVAMAYAVYHGPEGLTRIARRIHLLTRTLAVGLERLGFKVGQPSRPARPEQIQGAQAVRGSQSGHVPATGSAAFFDTLRIELPPGQSAEVVRRAESHRMNLRRIDDRTVGVSLDETVTEADLDELFEVFNGDQPASFTAGALAESAGSDLRYPEPLGRTTPFLTHPVFHRHHSETEMLRYLKRLEARDLSLTHSMIPLGSCTMKLNAAVEMMPISWPGFARLHPFAPAGQTEGYRELFRQLEQWLAEITGFAAVSLQPNAGSQGEYAGLLVIRAWHESRQEAGREICLIPTSAHGTNPASAVMAGLKVVAVACDTDGNVDLADLRAKAGEHRARLAALMVTYPSTHGVFESGIQEICRIVHEHGGQVYMDGANMNAQVGLCRPANIGADVCHLNLHKTFCIPHGGGGPGVGPICVAQHLAAFLPGHTVVRPGGARATGAVSAAPWGSASILPISWVYIAAMGAAGLTAATQVSILNANYVARRLEPYFPVLYKGARGLVAHECILDLRQFKSVTVEDVAKRLMDFGFHAPTVSWPVAGTIMVEPTESESKAELDRFCDALIAIHAEIQAVETGQLDARNNPLKNAPHTADQIAADRWDRPYSREQAAFPAPWLKDAKFWPSVGRIDNVFGDRNPVCTCVGMAAYPAGRRAGESASRPTPTLPGDRSDLAPQPPDRSTG